MIVRRIALIKLIAGRQDAAACRDVGHAHVAVAEVHDLVEIDCLVEPIFEQIPVSISSVAVPRENPSVALHELDVGLHAKNE